jgi:hypothetical protein
MWRNAGIATFTLILGPKRCGWSVLLPCCSTTEKAAPKYQLKISLVGSQCSVHLFGAEKHIFPLSGIETGSSVIHPLAQSLQATFQVLTTVLLKKVVWDVRLCCWASSYSGSEGSQCLHTLGSSSPRTKPESSSFMLQKLDQVKRKKNSETCGMCG